MQKNVASQKWIVFAFDRTDNTPKTGDAANITANLRLDGGGANAVDDTNPTELEDGYYIFDITQAESNANLIVIAPASSTSDIQVIGVPGAVYTTPANFPLMGIESDGDMTKVNLCDTNTDMVTEPPTVAQIQTEMEENGASLLDTIRDELANGTDGLGALKTLLDAIPTTAMRGTDGALTDKAGFSLSTAGILAIWHQLNSAIVTAGTMGKLLKDEITSARMAVLTDWIDGGRLDLLLDAVKAVTDTAGYEHNSIWIDTVNGTAGTVNYVNGTVDNPVKSIADANTLATSLGISRFEIASNSSITFAAPQTNQIFRGDKWILALGGQNVANSCFIGAAVSGVMAGTGILQYFIGCVVNATSVIKGTVFKKCLIASTITVVEAGEFMFDQCSSSVAGASAPTFDFGSALNSSNLSVRHYSGGWIIENMGAGTGTYNSSFEGDGQIIWAASCSATSNASIRGHWKITDNASGAVTETLDDIITDLNAVKLATDLLPADPASETNVNANETKIDALNDIATSDVLTQINAALDTAIAELGVAAPTATPTIRTGLMLLYMGLRNKLNITAISKEIHNDAGTKIAEKVLSDDDTTYTEEEMA